MPRLAAPTVLLVCAASLIAAPSAAAKLQLPPGADRAPDLPAGVVVAEHPSVTGKSGQRAGSGAVAGVARARSQPQSGPDRRPFWATVNICDTERSPNALGVRASVPGNGSNERIYARYTAQWWSSAEQQWKTVSGSGVTDWIYLGIADMSSRQGGWTFRFVQPPEGTTYVMRGVVELQWRDQAKAARKSRRARKHRKHRSVGKQRKQRTAVKQRKQRRTGKNRRAGKQRRVVKHRKARGAQRAPVVRERTLLTKTGMKGVQGGDPAGLSKAMCLIW